MVESATPTTSPTSVKEGGAHPVGRDRGIGLGGGGGRESRIMSADAGTYGNMSIHLQGVGSFQGVGGQNSE